MNIIYLLSQCQALGVIVAPGEGGMLRVSPPGVLPEELRQQLRTEKAKLLDYLQHPSPCRGCYTCQQRRFWRHGVTYRWICATCHPAPHVELIEEWHEAPEPAIPWGGVRSQSRENVTNASQ